MFHSLPEDMHYAIFQYLGPNDLKSAIHVCHTWRQCILTPNPTLNATIQRLFILACKHRFHALTETLLRRCHILSTTQNLALKEASIQNHIQIVDFLLANGRISQDVLKYVFTCRAYRIESIQRVLQNKNTDHTSKEMLWMRAIIQNDIATIQLLLQDTTINPAFDDQITLTKAIECGRIEIVTLLLNNSQIDPTASDNLALRKAAEYNRLSIVNRLLKCKDVDPAACDNEAIRLAARYGNFDVVRRLLKDKRVDPSARNNEALRMAQQNQHQEIACILLKDKKVRALLTKV